MTTRYMNTLMTYSDARIYDNGDIRMSHYDLRIRGQETLGCVCMEDTHHKNLTYLLSRLYL